jgi:hypothetical protein
MNAFKNLFGALLVAIVAASAALPAMAGPVSIVGFGDAMWESSSSRFISFRQ